MSRLEELVDLAAKLGFSEDTALMAHSALAEGPEWGSTQARGASGMSPRKPVIPIRTLRVPDELWESAQAIAKAREENLSADVLRPALERYVKLHRKLLQGDSK